MANIKYWLNEIYEELERATKEYGKFHSKHEAYGVIMEEIDEWWDEIKLKLQNTKNLEEETIQCGAMFLRFLIDIIETPTNAEKFKNFLHNFYKT